MRKSHLTAPAIILLSLLGALAPAPTAQAARGVRDNANFFSEPAEQQATAVIDRIAQNYRKDVLIESMAEPPAGVTPGQYATNRINSGEVNGVYVLIVRRGGQVSVRAGSQTRNLFNEVISNELAQQIDAGLRKGRDNWDNTLREAVAHIERTFTGAPPTQNPGAGTGPGTGTGTGTGTGAGTPIPPPGGSSTGAGTTPNPDAQTGGTQSGGRSGGAPPPGAPAPQRRGWFSGIWGWVCLIIGGLLIFNIIKGVMRARSFGQAGGAPGGYGRGGYGAPGYGGGGGGWGSGILGGLLGGAAGSFLYDRMFRGGSADAAPPPGDAGGMMGGGGWGGQDQPGGGFSAGDAGGGGDYGGGGADFGGGGDAGGGGDY